MMPQNLDFGDLLFLKNSKPRTKKRSNLYTELNLLRYLESHEPLNFSIKKALLRRETGLTVGEFTEIYKNYKALRGE